MEEIPPSMYEAKYDMDDMDGMAFGWNVLCPKPHTSTHIPDPPQPPPEYNPRTYVSLHTYICIMRIIPLPLPLPLPYPSSSLACPRIVVPFYLVYFKISFYEKNPSSFFFFSSYSFLLFWALFPPLYPPSLHCIWSILPSLLLAFHLSDSLAFAPASPASSSLPCLLGSGPEGDDVL